MRMQSMTEIVKKLKAQGLSNAEIRYKLNDMEKRGDITFSHNERQHMRIHNTEEQVDYESSKKFTDLLQTIKEVFSSTETPPLRVTSRNHRDSTGRLTTVRAKVHKREVKPGNPEPKGGGGHVEINPEYEKKNYRKNKEDNKPDDEMFGPRNESTLLEYIQMIRERCWKGYKPVKGKKAYSKGSCEKINEARKEKPFDIANFGTDLDKSPTPKKVKGFDNPEDLESMRSEIDYNHPGLRDAIEAEKNRTAENDDKESKDRLRVHGLYKRAIDARKTLAGNVRELKGKPPKQEKPATRTGRGQGRMSDDKKNKLAYRDARRDPDGNIITRQTPLSDKDQEIMDRSKQPFKSNNKIPF